MSGLGRRVPTDFRHLDKFPLRALKPEQRLPNVPVVFGINWYAAFDNPEKRGREWWITSGNLGPIRGGHAICSLPFDGRDSTGWHAFYDQGRTRACTGFSASRCMSLLNRKRFDAFWLWRQARLSDEWTDNDDLNDLEQGSSVRAAFEILRTQGHEVVRHGQSSQPDRAEGIAAYRWATSVDEVRFTLGLPDRRAGVPLLQSWGLSYPRVVWLPDEVLERLLSEDGEAAVPTDL